MTRIVGQGRQDGGTPWVDIMTDALHDETVRVFGVSANEVRITAGYTGVPNININRIPVRFDAEVFREADNKWSTHSVTGRYGYMNVKRADRLWPNDATPAAVAKVRAIRDEVIAWLSTPEARPFDNLMVQQDLFRACEHALSQVTTLREQLTDAEAAFNRARAAYKAYVDGEA